MVEKNLKMCYHASLKQHALDIDKFGRCQSCNSKQKFVRMTTTEIKSKT